MRRLALPLLLLVAWGVPLRAKTFVRGDADSNGRIELTDGIRILEFLFLAGPPPTCLDAADGDDDGRLRITDAVRIFLWLFGDVAILADPGPRQDFAVYESSDCGVDTTNDRLDCEAQATTCQRGPPGTVTLFDQQYEAAAVVFALDKSGSMASAGRWTLQTEGVTRAISTLSEVAEFGVVFYSGRVEVFPDTLVSATPANKQVGIDYVRSQIPLGDSCIAEGTIRALEIVRQSVTMIKAVIVISDGNPDVCATGNRASPAQVTLLMQMILAANPGLAVKVHTIWVGGWSDLAGQEFLRQLAEAHGGTFQAVGI